MEFREFVSACLRSGQGKEIVESVDRGSIPERVGQEEKKDNDMMHFKAVTDSRMSVVSNLFGSSDRILKALNINASQELYDKLDACIEDPPSLNTAEWNEKDYTIIDTPDLTQSIPNIKYSRDDATPYLTSGIVLTADPDTGRPHICFIRLSIAGDNRLLFNAATATISGIVKKTVSQGKELDVAILIGPPVEVILAACVPAAEHLNKLQLAQSISDGTTTFTRDPLPIPLGTEIILRGRVIPEYSAEGPFGDIKGLYSVKEKVPVCLIDQQLHRNNPLYHSISAGTSKEHILSCSLGPGYRLSKLRKKHQGIIDFDIPVFGVCRLAVIKVERGFDPDLIQEELWKIPIIRLFIIVNEDIDLTSSSDYFWAIIHRTGDAADFIFQDQKGDLFKESKIIVNATVSDHTSLSHKRVAINRS